MWVWGDFQWTRRGRVPYFNFSNSTGELRVILSRRKKVQSAYREWETKRLIGCLCLDAAQAPMALADRIRQFPAYRRMQPNGYKMVCFAFIHAAYVSYVQATKHKLRQSQHIRWSKTRR